MATSLVTDRRICRARSPKTEPSGSALRPATSGLLVPVACLATEEAAFGKAKEFGALARVAGWRNDAEPSFELKVQGHVEHPRTIVSA